MRYEARRWATVFSLAVLAQALDVGWGWAWAWEAVVAVVGLAWALGVWADAERRP